MSYKGIYLTLDLDFLSVFGKSGFIKYSRFFSSPIIQGGEGGGGGVHDYVSGAGLGVDSNYNRLIMIFIRLHFNHNRNQIF